MLIQKDSRTYTENRIVEFYFQNMPEINTLVKNYHSSYEDSLSSFASAVSGKVYQKNSIVFKTGDKSDKLFIILSGEAAVIATRERNISLSFSEYKKYLRTLLKYNEHYVLMQTLWINHDIYPISETDLMGKDGTHNIPTVRKSSLLKFNINKKKMLETLSNFQDNNLFSLSPEEYAQRIKPAIRPSDNKQKITIFEYFVVNSLKSGDIFGNLSLAKYHNRRSATVITRAKSCLAYVNIEDMNRILNNNRSMSDVCKIISFYFMWNVNKMDFMQDFYKFFIPMKLIKGDALFKQDETRTRVFFVKSGEFNANCNMNLREINKLMRSFGINNERELNKRLSSSDYFELLEREVEVEVFFTKKKEVFGLEDSVLDNKFIYSLKCESEVCEVYSLELLFLNKLIEASNDIKTSINSYVSKRRNDLMTFFIRKKAEIVDLKIMNRDIKIEENYYFPMEIVKEKESSDLIKNLKSLGKWPKTRNSPYKLFMKRMENKLSSQRSAIKETEVLEKVKSVNVNRAKKFYGKVKRAKSKEDWMNWKGMTILKRSKL